MKIPRGGGYRELSPEVEDALVEWAAMKTYDNKAVNRT
jgi:hypothetical protein